MAVPSTGHTITRSWRLPVPRHGLLANGDLHDSPDSLRTVYNCTYMTSVHTDPLAGSHTTWTHCMDACLYVVGKSRYRTVAVGLRNTGLNKTFHTLNSILLLSLLGNRIFHTTNLSLKLKKVPKVRSRRETCRTQGVGVVWPVIRLGLAHKQCVRVGDGQHRH